MIKSYCAHKIIIRIYILSLELSVLLHPCLSWCQNWGFLSQSTWAWMSEVYCGSKCSLVCFFMIQHHALVVSWFSFSLSHWETVGEKLPIYIWLHLFPRLSVSYSKSCFVSVTLALFTVDLFSLTITLHGAHPSASSDKCYRPCDNMTRCHANAERKERGDRGSDPQPSRCDIFQPNVNTEHPQHCKREK